MKKLIALAFLAATVTGCSSLKSGSNRLLASDLSITEAAVIIETVRNENPQLDLSEFEGRVLAYRAIDTVVGVRNGELTPEEGREEVLRILTEMSDND